MSDPSAEPRDGQTREDFMRELAEIGTIAPLASPFEARTPLVVPYHIGPADTDEPAKGEE